LIGGVGVGFFLVCKEVVGLLREGSFPLLRLGMVVGSEKGVFGVSGSLVALEMVVEVGGRLLSVVQFWWADRVSSKGG
jgi:hypothetical protein